MSFTADRGYESKNGGNYLRMQAAPSLPCRSDSQENLKERTLG